MKNIFLAIGAAALVVASCHSNPETPQAAADTVTTDTAGLAAFQAFKAQQEKDSLQKVQDSITRANRPLAAKPKPARHQAAASTAVRSSSGNDNTASESISSESANTAERKKGWSKTAKGAVIGGVVGAGAGAVINKKNRTKGAIIGGAAGAGAGAIIGHDQDKKDGRH
ncbi:YMGG-like glycine zipper-containing protein [Paraflavisolibacter sp. H34]|uniref:YMGG-like glycine zipper-containing protein n=1 Tax=Huijunlia imazamoxiresistens TaxID=3127457 RepID=UPI003017A8DD